MFLVHPEKNKTDINLYGAVQISNTAFLVYKNSQGKVELKTGKEEKLQKKSSKKYAFKKSGCQKAPRQVQN